MESSSNVPRGVLPKSHPSAALLSLATKNGMEDGYASAGSAGPTEKFAVDKNLGKVSSGNGTGKSPVDKSFLLGFLEDVARRGRSRATVYDED
jgi:mRNA-decapping enzyme subunit 2